MWSRTGKSAVALLSICLLVAGTLWVSQPAAQRQSLIVQGQTLVEARRAVRSVGGEITHELKIIKAVGALLTEPQIRLSACLAKVARAAAETPLIPPITPIWSALQRCTPRVSMGTA